MRHILRLSAFLLAFILSNGFVSFSQIELYPTQNLELKVPPHQEIPKLTFEPEFELEDESTSRNTCADLDWRSRNPKNIPLQKFKGKPKGLFVIR
jgi:hypothetical protein